MASKLLRKIAPSTPVQHSGRLLGFDRNCLGRELNKGALDFGSNRQWRRLEKVISAQVLQLSFYELSTLIASYEREQAYDDFDILVMRYGEAKALDIMRSWIVDNHLWTELLRVSMDFTCVRSKHLDNIAIKLMKVLQELKLQVKKLLKQTQDSYRLKVIKPVMRLPQRSPNAPNYSPALSLAAA